MNFSSLAKAAGSVVDAAKAKAKDVAHDAAAITNRVTQHALESAGMGDKSEEDETLPELKKHLRLDRHLRALYKHADAYLRSVSAMVDASKAVADDLAEAAEAYPELQPHADKHHACTHLQLSEQMQVLGQLIHQKVFKPIRAEVEGRKDVEKRLAERKKVRADYDAYRRKQLHGLHSDPGNAATYEANLENARATFERHSQLVAHDLGAVAAERDKVLAEAFLALSMAQGAFYASFGASLAAAAPNARALDSSADLSAAFAAVSQQHDAIKAHVRSNAPTAPPPPRRRRLRRRWRRVAAHAHRARGRRRRRRRGDAARASVRVGARGAAARLAARARLARYIPPDLTGGGQQAAQQQQQQRSSAYVPPQPRRLRRRLTFSVASAAAAAAAARPMATAAAAAAAAARRRSICWAVSAAAAAAAAAAARARPGSAVDLMGMDGGGGGAMDDLFQLSAPGPLMPSRRRRRRWRARRRRRRAGRRRRGWASSARKRSAAASAMTRLAWTT